MANLIIKDGIVLIDHLRGETMEEKEYLLEVFHLRNPKLDRVQICSKSLIIKLYPYVEYMLSISDFKQVRWTLGKTIASIKKMK